MGEMLTKTTWHGVNMLSTGPFYSAPTGPAIKAACKSFQFCFGISVFTHLREKAQMQWLEELHRITAPGGGLVMSVRGDTSLGFGFNRKLNEWVYLRERDGYLNVGVDSRINEQLEDQSYYVNCLQSRKYIQEKWGQYFDILDIVSAGGIHQDFVIMKKNKDENLFSSQRYSCWLQAPAPFNSRI